MSRLFAGRSGCSSRVVQSAVAVVAMVGIATEASAMSRSNNVGMHVGDRPMGMGGAAAGISDDPSGLYYNPAGIVYGHAPNLSASVNAFHITSNRYADTLGEGSDWERNSDEFLPNFFGTTQPLGPVTVGFSVVVPQSVREEQAQTFDADAIERDAVQAFSINVDNEDTINRLGPSIAFEVNDRLSLGASLHLHQHERQTITTQVLLLEDEATSARDYEVQNQYVTSEQVGVSWLVGAMFTPLERVAIGVSVRGTEIFDATNSTQTLCHGADVEAYEADHFCQSGSVTFQDRTEDSVREAYPVETRVGAAWFATQRLLLAADVIHSSGFGGREPVTNFAAGAEYYLTADWAIRLGGFTDFSNVDEVAYDGFDHSVDRFGGSLSLTRFTQNTSVSVGVTGSYGTGEAYIIDDPNVGAQDLTSTTATLFLATSYSY
ncbi:OmpP1/FadL family transporter [Halorhodospira halophila]|uniref:Membrane protein involved in aromatic hydrocarbon degradation n=1 Tax=Halorhodospira halophila (strain DSM 244 / SL1) TaxID=349124 RepID=A1WY88_HALHL|nr:outer membrane protein transport protein [Halorhodospira halophila]ABM62650.1 membrane protein involved in aromatic hydrocarbon degradation [Halorhodospira halophila SL1]MBK1728330.1 hypothetical protein [Halorhodospira halophila]